MKQMKVSDMLRKACEFKTREGMEDFTFTAVDMTAVMVREYAAKNMPDADLTEEQIENEALSWLDKDENSAPIYSKLTSPYVNPTVTRYFAKLGKRVRVTLNRDDVGVTIGVEFLEGEPMPRERKSRAKVAVVEDRMAGFTLDISKLPDGTVTARDLNEVMRQVKEFVLKGIK